MDYSNWLALIPYMNTWTGWRTMKNKAQGVWWW